MDWLKHALEWIKLKPKYLFGIGLTSLTVVALPESWREYLGYNKVIAPHRGWLSLVSLVFLVYGFFLFLTSFESWIKNKWINWVFRSKAPSKLAALTADEKMYLAEYLRQRSSSLNFPLSDGIINSLELKYIVYRGSPVSVEGDVFPWNIQPWVLKTIDKKPDLKTEILGHASSSRVDHQPPRFSF